MQSIKWFPESYFEQNVLLGNIPFNLVFNWNTRGEAWSMSISTNDNETLLFGKKLNINTDLLSDIHSESKPQGYLIVVPIAKDVQIITRDNMGSELLLIFIGFDEVL